MDASQGSKPTSGVTGQDHRNPTSGAGAAKSRFEHFSGAGDDPLEQDLLATQAHLFDDAPPSAKSVAPVAPRGKLPHKVCTSTLVHLMPLKHGHAK